MIIFLPVIVPVIISFLIFLCGEKRDKLRYIFLFTASIFDFLAVIFIMPLVLKHDLPPLILLHTTFFDLKFKVDILSLLLAVVVTFLWIVTNSYSIGYMEKNHSLRRYYTALAFCEGAVMGIIFAADLFTLFVFYELLTISVFPLIIHEETEEAAKAGIMYLVYTLSGGAMILFGCFITYALNNGNIEFMPGGMPGLAGQNKIVLYLLFILFTCGFGVKGALVPLHAWLPRAMVAPTPISALLHAVAVVNVGTYGLIRMIYNIFGRDLFLRLHLNTILALVCVITVLGAAFMAFKQRQLKKLLAYSTVNQLGYVVLGASSLNYWALTGGLVHIMYHSIMKISLFYAAGMIIRFKGKIRIPQLSGISKEMPVTMACFVIGVIGIVGLPPMAGWLSKWNLVKGHLLINEPVLASVFLINTVIEVGYFLPPILYAYFGVLDESPGSSEKTSEAPLNMLIPLVIVTVLSFTFGLFGSLPYVLSNKAAAELLMIK
ncbi:MAG: proton-conducting transporter membrane subunit [bacterium]|nr:proton-conducting transporter membrane subunit [bacterium]